MYHTLMISVHPGVHLESTLERTRDVICSHTARILQADRHQLMTTQHRNTTHTHSPSTVCRLPLSSDTHYRLDSIGWPGDSHSTHTANDIVHNTTAIHLINSISGLKHSGKPLKEPFSIIICIWECTCTYLQVDNEIPYMSKAWKLWFA